ncbi:hypothetical protein FQN50_008995 [Emmonsiellopsis sp. PD_5]|nr:hypothetical protein FQN50_008995 [Emmonsiellopsis sp. PD_5]
MLRAIELKYNGRQMSSECQLHSRPKESSLRLLRAKPLLSVFPRCQSLSCQPTSKFDLQGFFESRNMTCTFPMGSNHREGTDRMARDVSSQALIRLPEVDQCIMVHSEKWVQALRLNSSLYHATVYA